MLSLSVAADRVAVSGQYDPGPEVIDRLNRFSSWLDPLVHRPVAATFLIAGTIAIVAAARLSGPRRTAG
jgi:hypothetical protein